MLCRFNLEKHHSYLAFSFLTTLDFFYWLFWGFLTLNIYTVPCSFLDRVQNHNGYVSVIILKSKHISGTWFVVCLSLNIRLPPFSDILTWKCIKHTYLVAVYILNTGNTPYFFVYKCEKRNLCLPCFFSIAKHQSYVFSYFETSKYVNRYLVCSLFLSKCVFSAIFCSLTCNCKNSTYPVNFKLEKHHLHFSLTFPRCTIFTAFFEAFKW